MYKYSETYRSRHSPNEHPTLTRHIIGREICEVRANKHNTKKYVQAGTRVLLNTGTPVATALNQASNKSLAIIARHW